MLHYRAWGNGLNRLDVCVCVCMCPHYMHRGGYYHIGQLVITHYPECHRITVTHLLQAGWEEQMNHGNLCN